MSIAPYNHCATTYLAADKRIFIPTYTHVTKETSMSSKTHQKKMIKKHKRHANKANLRADRKRMEKNHAVLYPNAG